MTETESTDRLGNYMGKPSRGLLAQYVGSRATSLPRYVCERAAQALLGWAPGLSGMALRALAYAPLMARGSRMPFCENRVEWMFMNRIRIGRGVYVDSGCRIHASKAEIVLGAGTRVMRGAYLCAYVSNARAGEGIETGENCWIGVDAVLGAGQGGIVLGDRVLIAPQAVLVCGDHDFERTDQSVTEQAYTGKPIRVGNDVWIGAHATVLGGVTIGERAVVAAGAVVNGDVEPFTVVGGVPARVLKRIESKG